MGVVGALASARAWTDTAHTPFTGTNDDETVHLDELMLQFVEEQHIDAAALAVAVNGRLAYARGFGITDRERRQPVFPTALFRIASVSKSLTAVAVLQLVESKALQLDTKVWTLLGLREPSDKRWKAVTVLNLLQHTGGWDVDQTQFDPMFSSATIARALKTPLPVNAQQVIGYMLTQSLQFDPGSRYAYSNFGYCLLGRIVEHVAGMAYEHYVQRDVLAPLGVHRMRLAKTSLADRLPTEVAYYDEGNRTARAVVGDIDRVVPVQYGAWSLEIMDANGGWLAAAPDLVRFASVFYETTRCRILRPETIELMFARPEGEAGVEVEGNYPGCGWFVWPHDTHAHRAHSSSNGVIAGTSSYLMRRYDGIAWAVLFNRAKGSDDQPLSIKFRDVSAGPISRVRNWPVPDQFGQLLSDR